MGTRIYICIYIFINNLEIKTNYIKYIKMRKTKGIMDMTFKICHLGMEKGGKWGEL